MQTRIGYILMIAGLACGFISYDGYLKSAEAVKKFSEMPETRELFDQLTPQISNQSVVMGFFSVVLLVAGLKLRFSRPRQPEGELL